MRVEYLADGVTLYCGDCREVDLPRDAAVVSDPPYGIAHKTVSTRLGRWGRLGKRVAGEWDGGAIHGDAEPFDPAHLLKHKEVILWGGNFFADKLPAGGYLVWVKQYPHLFGTFLGDAELAWRAGSKGVFCHYKPFKSPTPAMEEAGGVKGHPTQKPISLMEWCIGMTKAAHIIDPYMGSGTTGVAAVRLGRRFTGVEIHPPFFETACRRIADELKRPRLALDGPPPAAVQEPLFTE